eukprot:TRINITY_DN16848_c0_g1_i1.p3 TRINITY_DN16848_c0_g1~~TRINITY_DN16848_c0_g1_i1.p3  ORF type:complete len:103 (-),score=4.39 TRINITY_DN16848_c0_g1_i1:23-331(-)
MDPPLPHRQPAGLWDASATPDCFSTDLDLDSAAPLLGCHSQSVLLGKCACDLAVAHPDDRSFDSLRTAMANAAKRKETPLVCRNVRTRNWRRNGPSPATSPS